MFNIWVMFIFIGHPVLWYIETLISIVSHLSAALIGQEIEWLSALSCTTYFEHVQKLKYCLYFRLFSIVINESSICKILYIFSILWSANCTNLVCKFCILFRAS